MHALLFSLGKGTFLCMFYHWLTVTVGKSVQKSLSKIEKQKKKKKQNKKQKQNNNNNKNKQKQKQKQK